MPWGLDEAGSPVQGEMGLTFFDMKCRKSVKDGEMRNICPKKGKSVAQSRPADAADQPGGDLDCTVGGVIAKFSNLLQSLFGEELTFRFTSE